MKTRAAIAWEPGKSLEVDEVEIDGPRRGEVLVQLAATGVCHTDAFTLSGDDPEGVFPAILGHEGGGVVADCQQLLAACRYLFTECKFCVPEPR